MGQSKPFRATALVVEDDDIQREMIALLLEESDFDVIQCEDAETALLALRMYHPSMLVTDINLAGKVNGGISTRRTFERFQDARRGDLRQASRIGAAR